MESIADRNFARVCSAISPRYHDGADVTPPLHYPLATVPARLAMYDHDHRAGDLVLLPSGAYAPTGRAPLDERARTSRPPD
jgi:hypothetical protein